MKELFDTERLSDEDVVIFYGEYLKKISSEQKRGNALSRDDRLILTQGKYHKRPCQVENSKTKCPYGSDLESCTYSNVYGCYMTEIIINFAKSRSLLP